MKKLILLAILGALVAFTAFNAGRMYQYVNDVEYPIHSESK